MKKLEKEVEEWLDKKYLKDMGVRKPCREAYLAAAKPREKQIEVLEKENEELTKKLEGAERARDYWKDSSFDWRHKCTSRKPFKAAVKAQKQLSKAKVLLAKWVELYKPKLEDFPKPPIQVDTEQFLSEVEE